jgi:tetratricopeptide (TPR) repeat protein
LIQHLSVALAIYHPCKTWRDFRLYYIKRATVHKANKLIGYGSKNEAEKIASENDPEFSSRLFRAGIGNLLHNLSHYEEAIACYEKAIEYKPDDDAAWNNIGITQAKQQNYEGAVISYDKALEIQPRNSIAWLNRGIALVELGRYEEALASYDKVIELKTHAYKAWYNRALVLAKLKSYEETVLSYDKALEIVPNCYKSWNNRGIALADMNRFEEAIESYEQAAILKPLDPYPHYNKACCYGLQGRTEEALNDLQKAIALEPGQFRKRAKADSDFDLIRNDQRFQALLIQSSSVDMEDARKREPEPAIRSNALRLFYSYSHKDEALRDELEVRLKLLQRQNLIQPWHDRRILPGTDWKQELDTNLEQADIILLLVSPDFINSDYCCEIEMTRAMERHNANEAQVLPILLRPVNWNELSFRQLQALPTSLKPVTKWADPDDAWLDIEKGIRDAITRRRDRPSSTLH